MCAGRAEHLFNSCACPAVADENPGLSVELFPQLLTTVFLPRNLSSSQVLIAACDTFRSGAVEQLRVHCRCLDVPLFEKGTGFLVLAQFALLLIFRQTLCELFFWIPVLKTSPSCMSKPFLFVVAWAVIVFSPFVRAYSGRMCCQFTEKDGLYLSP